MSNSVGKSHFRLFSAKSDQFYFVSFPHSFIEKQKKKMFRICSIFFLLSIFHQHSFRLYLNASGRQDDNVDWYSITLNALSALNILTANNSKVICFKFFKDDLTGYASFGSAGITLLWIVPSNVPDFISFTANENLRTHHQQNKDQISILFWVRTFHGCTWFV